MSGLGANKLVVSNSIFEVLRCLYLRLGNRTASTLNPGIVLPYYPLLTHSDSFQDVQFVSTLGVRYTFAKSEELYKKRHLVECFFNKLKHFRRCFARFDKLACTYLSFLYFASTLIWLR